MTRLLWLALLLSGCSQIAQFTAGDAANAARIDPGDAACYEAIGAVASGYAGAANAPGLLTLAAVKKSAQAALSSPQCAAIEAQVLGEILKATPAAPFVP